MKKRGSALVTVLIACTTLIILATAVSVGVVNTAKLNKKYSEDIDLELAAKSGLNIFKEELLSDIEKVKNSSDLPGAVEETDSGINSFDNITIIKEIKKENIENEGTITGYKYTIISTAKYKSIENSISKKVSQVINVNLKNNESNSGENEEEGDIGDIVIEPVNFINFSGKIEIANTNQKDEDLIKKISTGDEFRLKGQLVDAEKNDKLKNLNVSLNTSIIEDNIKSNANVDTSIPIDINSIEKKDSIDRIKNNTNTEINNETVKFEGNIDFANDLSIKLKDSIVFINGKLNGYSNSNITLNLENSILVISEGVYTSDKLNINLSNDSTLYIKNLSAGKDLSIKMNSGKIIAKNDVIESRNGKAQIELENNSIIYSENRLFGQNGIYITMNNSSILVKDIDSNNGELVSNIENESIIYCKNQLKSNKAVTINTDNSNLFVEESNLESTGEKINISIKNKSNIFVGKKIYSPKANSINIDNSNIIIGFKLQNLYDEALTSNNEINIKSLNGTCIINGKLTVANGIKAELENSAIICMGEFNIHSGLSKLVNLDKSYVLILGKIDKSYITNLELESKTNSITPDSKNVINTLNEYLKSSET